MTIPAFRDGDRQKFIPVPLSNWSDADLAAANERIRTLEAALQWALDIIESGQRPAIDFSGKSGYFAQYKALLAQDETPSAPRAVRPTVVCLCGSTRFMDEFHRQGAIETLAGRIVLSVGVFVHGPPDHAGEALGEDVKRQLDELHKRKIDLADEVLFLNVGGYMGESTRSELAYAQAHGKVIRFLEPNGLS